MNTKEIVTGISGNGNTVYMVVTVEAKTGNWLWIEKFDTKVEAENWLKWS